MSDDRELTPEQEARVARLLADARADGEIPGEVAARLDQVLAGMANEQIAGPDQQAAPVIDLAARRRRRAATLLVAAAAVVVAGLGIGRMIGPNSGDDDTAADSGGTSLEREDAADGVAPAGPGDAPMGQKDLEALGEPAKLSTDSFAADVRRLQDRPGVRSYASSDALMDGSDLAAQRMDFSCGPAAYGAGKLLAVRYNGLPAVLAYRPAAGDTQTVELLQCGSAEVVRSTTIPLP